MGDLGDLIKRIIKYCLMGFFIAMVVYVIPKQKVNVEEITLIALSAAAIFLILDMFLPSVSSSARTGLGFAIGTGLSQGIKLM